LNLGIIKARQERDVTQQSECEVTTSAPTEEEPRRSAQKKRRKSLWNKGTIKKVRKESPKKVECRELVLHPAPRARAYLLEMDQLLEDVILKTERSTVFELLNIRYKLCIVVEQHQQNVNKVHLITELQQIIDAI